RGRRDDGPGRATEVKCGKGAVQESVRRPDFQSGHRSAVVSTWRAGRVNALRRGLTAPARRFCNHFSGRRSQEEPYLRLRVALGLRAELGALGERGRGSEAGKGRRKRRYS